MSVSLNLNVNAKMNMTHGSLFSGIGGFDLAAECMGWQNLFHCELNPFGQKILTHYWPKAISYHDVTQTDFTIHRGTIDVLTGGFPCQPYSAAGKRLGKEDDRHLWPEMLRAIREIQPRWVVGENVRGLVNWNGGLVFDEVQADLEAEGYEVQPFLLPAAGVNAPHERYRIWFVAHRADARAEGVRRERENPIHGLGAATYSNNGQCEQQEQALCTGRDAFSLGSTVTPNTASERSRESFKKRFSELAKQDGEKRGNAAYSKNQRFQRFCDQGESRREKAEVKTRGGSSGSVCTDWDDFPTQSPVCNGDDGLPARLDGITFPKWRNESIKGGGNAIVPQEAYQIFKAIQEYENTMTT